MVFFVLRRTGSHGGWGRGVGAQQKKERGMENFGKIVVSTQTHFQLSIRIFSLRFEATCEVFTGLKEMSHRNRICVLILCGRPQMPVFNNFILIMRISSAITIYTRHPNLVRHYGLFFRLFYSNRLRNLIPLFLNSTLTNLNQKGGIFGPHVYLPTPDKIVDLEGKFFAQN